MGVEFPQALAIYLIKDTQCVSRKLNLQGAIEASPHTQTQTCAHRFLSRES